MALKVKNKPIFDMLGQHRFQIIWLCYVQIRNTFSHRKNGLRDHVETIISRFSWNKRKITTARDQCRQYIYYQCVMLPIFFFNCKQPTTVPFIVQVLKQPMYMPLKMTLCLPQSLHLRDQSIKLRNKLREMDTRWDGQNVLRCHQQLVNSSLLQTSQ